LSETCSCPCVREIYSAVTNLQIEDVSETSPKFLRIDNVEIKALPDLAKEVTEFNHIRKDEWLPKKKDKRFKRRKR